MLCHIIKVFKVIQGLLSYLLLVSLLCYLLYLVGFYAISFAVLLLGYQYFGIWRCF